MAHIGDASKTPKYGNAMRCDQWLEGCSKEDVHPCHPMEFWQLHSNQLAYRIVKRSFSRCHHVSNSRALLLPNQSPLPQTAMMLEPRKGTFSYYHYDPSVAAAILFIVLFLLTTLLHSYQMFRTRTWFLVPFVLGGLCKCAETCPKSPS